MSRTQLAGILVVVLALPAGLRADDPVENREAVKRADEDAKRAAAEAAAADVAKKAEAARAEAKKADAKKAEAKTEKKTEEKPAETKADETKPADTPPKEKPTPREKPGVNPAKPFADLIKRFLPQPTVPAKNSPTAPAVVEEKKKDEKPKKPRHPSDGRAPYDPKKAQLFSRAQGMVERQQWATALELLQKISEDPEDSLVQSTDGRWVSLRLEVDRIRSQAPADLLKDYRLQYGQVASDKLQAALGQGESEGLGQIVAAWFNTDAGVHAANALAARHVDRGEFQLAGRLYSRLWEAKVPGTRDKQWRLRAAYAIARSGDLEQARKLLTEGETSASVGGTDMDIAKWLAEASQPITRPQPVLKEWPGFFGGARRNAKSAGDEPLLLPRWNVALSERPRVRERLQHLQEDLIDAGMPALPQMSPVMIGGKVAFRTLYGIQVVEALTGKLLWQTENEVPIESAMSGQNFASYDAWGNMQFRGRVFMGGMADFQSDSGESGALANLLFRNANFGLISSDGQKLFVVEDPMILSNRMPGMGWWWWGDQSMQASANKLSAYDFNTGRPLWTIGGESNGEAFEPPLTGHFFFGPPLADRGELLVVGEKDNEIRLFALDPETGKAKWGQLIGLSESGIGLDVGRRWWTSQVAVSEGIITCITTTGWVVAVDRASHSLIWGVPLYPSPPGDMNNGPVDQQKMVMFASLNQRWTNAPPVISGDRVILTVPNPMPQNGSGDPQSLLCLHLGTGKELWKKPRKDMVALAGVFGDRVLCLRQHGMQAFALADGKELWSRDLTAPDSPQTVPAGRGVAVGPHYYQPLSNGEVWAIDIEKGEVANKAWTTEGGLGNLAMYEGMLLSLGLNGMSAFEQRRAVEDQIAKRKASNAADPWALIRESEIHVLYRRHPESLANLKRIDREAVPADLKGRFQSLLVESLTAEIQRQLDKPEAASLLDDLKSLSKSADDVRHYRRLLVDRQIVTGEFAPAFETLLVLATENPADLVDLDGHGTVQVRADLWVSGRLEDLFARLPAEVRPDLDARVQELTKTALEQPPAEQQKYLRTFGWHAAAHEVRWKLLEHFAKAGEFLKSERILLQLARGQDDAGKAKILARRAELLEQFQLKPDAVALYAQLVEKYPTSPEAAAAKAADKLVKPAGPDTLDWHGRPAHVERIGTNYYSNNYLQTVLGDRRLPFYRRYALEIPQQEQRLEVVDTLTDKTVWSQPLRSRNGNDSTLAMCEVNGYQVTVMYQGVLQMLSPVEKKVLWALNPESRNTQQFYPGNMQNPLPAMQSQLTLQNRQTRRRPFGMTSLSAANLEYVCRQDRRSMTVHDALTGEVLWKANGVRQGTRCFGNEDRLYLLMPTNQTQGQSVAGATNVQIIAAPAIRILGGRRTEVAVNKTGSARNLQFVLYRPRDGKRLEVSGLNELADSTMDVVDGDLILSGPRDGKSPVQIRRHDPVARSDRWTHNFPADCELALLDDGDLAVLSRTVGTLERLDLRAGARTVVGTLPSADLKKNAQLYAFADLDRVYLAVNTRSDGMFYYSYDGLQNLRISGTLYAFDPGQKKLVWQQKIENNTLVLERLDHSPYLVFLTQRPRKQVVMLHVVVLEKTTGERLAEQDLTYSYSGLRNLVINATDGYVEVRGYQERVRVLAGKPPEKKDAPQ